MQNKFKKKQIRSQWLVFCIYFNILKLIMKVHVYFIFTKWCWKYLITTNNFTEYILAIGHYLGGIISIKSLLRPLSWSFFSLCHLLGVLYLQVKTFKSLFHFKFIFICGVSSGSNFILLYVDIQFSQPFVLKRLSFPYCVLYFPPLWDFWYSVED